MDDVIASLLNGIDLDAAQVDHAIDVLASDKTDDGWKADFLGALHSKGEAASEIAGFAEALLARAIDPQLDCGSLPGPMLDICGTGGDKLELFNISTTAMFILAAGGVCVVKHGNRAITSKCGGADVLEKLGVTINLEPAALRRCVESHGLGFIFAPAYHPVFKALAPVRKALAERGIPTIFNLLGPLLNPARPPYQLIGVFSPLLLPKYAEALAHLGRACAWAVHGSGMDELSLAGPSVVHELSGGLLNERIVDPVELGFPLCSLSELRGGECRENADILMAVLNGKERGPKRDIVLLNAAAGFVITGLAPDLVAALALARQQIDSGRALSKLHALQGFS